MSFEFKCSRIILVVCILPGYSDRIIEITRSSLVWRLFRPLEYVPEAERVKARDAGEEGVPKGAAVRVRLLLLPHRMDALERVQCKYFQCHLDFGTPACVGNLGGGGGVEQGRLQEALCASG